MAPPDMSLSIAVVHRPGSRQRPAPGVGAQAGESLSGETWLQGIWPRETWDVVCLHDRCGTEVEQPLASFSHRQHAEAFLDDLLTSDAAGSPDLGCPNRGLSSHGPDLF